MIKKLILVSISLYWLGTINASFEKLEQAIAHSDVAQVKQLIKDLDLHTAKNPEQTGKTLLTQAQQVALKRKEQHIFNNGWDAAKFSTGCVMFMLGVAFDGLMYLSIKSDERDPFLGPKTKKLYFKYAAIGAGFGTTAAVGGLWLAIKGWHCSRQQQLQERAEKIVELLEEHTS